MSVPEGWLERREARRRELAKLRKWKLVTMCHNGVRGPGGGRTRIEGGQAPVSRWRTDEIITSILDVEYPRPETR